MIARPLEDHLVLLAARPRLAGPAEAMLRNLCASAPDWATVERVSSEQGVLPVVGSTLMCVGLMPPGPGVRFRARMRVIAARNLLLTQELLRLIALLAEAGVGALAFKGPVAAKMLYGGLSLREFDDLDLLVDPASFDEARRTLMGAGYRPALELRPEHEKLLLAQSAELTFLGRHGIRIDLHMSLTVPRHSLRLATSDVLRSAVRTDLFGGVRVSTLSQPDMAIYLSMHGIRHRWVRLEWLCDLARLLDRMAPQEHSSLVERARRLGHERAVLAAMILADRVLGAAGSPSGRVGPSTDLLARSFEEMLMVPTKVNPLELHYITAYDRHRDRVRHLFEVVFRPSLTDALAFRLPRPLYFLYWLVRPLRLGLRLARWTPRQWAGWRSVELHARAAQRLCAGRAD